MALEFSIEIDDKGTPKLRKFQGEVKKTGENSLTASQSIIAVSKGLAAIGATAAAGGAALFAFSKEVAGSRDKITKLGREFGVTTEFLSGMGHAAQLGGSDLKTVEKGMAKLSRTVADAQSGLATAQRGFTDLGIQIEDSNGVLKTNDQLLFEVADKFKEMPDGVMKAAKAQEIFGRSGKNLINTLNQGSEGLKRQISEAEALGIAFSEEAGKEAEAFNDELLRLETAAQGSLTPIADEMIPLITNAFMELQTAVGIAGPGMIQIFEALKPVLKDTLGLLVDTALGWSQIVKEIGDFLDFKKELEKRDEETTDKEITNLLKKMDANKKAHDEEKKLAELAEKNAERIAEQKLINARRLREKKRKEAERAAERHAKELLRIEEKQLQEQEKMLDEIFNKIKEEQDKEQAEKEAFADKQKEMERDLTNFFKSENDLRLAEIKETYDKRVEYLGATTEVEKARMMEIAELQKEIEQQRRNDLENQFNQIGEFASIASTTLNNIYQKDQNNINSRFDERQQKIEESFAQQIKAAEGNAKKEEELARRRDEKLKALDVKREKELQRSAKRTALFRKRAAQLEAIVNTAAAVTKAGVITPLAIATGIAGASQVALIESQQFFKGGMTGEAGQENISVGENGREFVVSAGGTRQAGEAALQDINNGRLEDAANRLLAQSNRPSGGITLQINGGIIDEQFLENSLIPRIKEFERRI